MEVRGIPYGAIIVSLHAESFDKDGVVGVVYTHTSPDGDEGYPGPLNAKVTYTLGAANALTVDYEATIDTSTPVNLTQHSYFNLAGEGSGDILSHRLTIDADRFTPVDATLNVHQRRSGLCLETQHFPDSPNHDTFPSAIVRPGTPYRSTTVFTFGVSNRDATR